MPSDVLDFDPRSFGTYALTNIAATAFLTPNYPSLKDWVVVDVPQPVMKYVLENRMRRDETVGSLPSWNSEQQQAVAGGLLAGPKSRLQMGCGGYFEGRLGFVNGRHRTAGMLHFGAPVIPIELERASASTFTAEFDLPPPRASAEFHGAQPHLVDRCLRGFPPGLVLPDNATINDDFRTVETYRKVNDLEAKNHSAVVLLAEKMPGMMKRYDSHDLKERGISDTRTFLNAWQVHLARQIKSGNGAKPSVLPFDWKKLPSGETMSPVPIKPASLKP